MLHLTCSAVCCNFEICLMACPHNAHLGEMAVPVCDAPVEEFVDDDEELLFVVEEQSELE